MKKPSPVDHVDNSSVGVRLVGYRIVSNRYLFATDMNFSLGFRIIFLGQMLSSVSYGLFHPISF